MREEKGSERPGGSERFPETRPSHAALGRAIYLARSERGLTQEMLSLMADLHTTYLSGVERGLRNPTWAVLARISQGLEIKLSSLVAMAESLDEHG